MTVERTVKCKIRDAVPRAYAAINCSRVWVLRALACVDGCTKGRALAFTQCPHTGCVRLANRLLRRPISCNGTRTILTSGIRVLLHWYVYAFPLSLHAFAVCICASVAYQRQVNILMLLAIDSSTRTNRRRRQSGMTFGTDFANKSRACVCVLYSA